MVNVLAMRLPSRALHARLGVIEAGNAMRGRIRDREDGPSAQRGLMPYGMGVPGGGSLGHEQARSRTGGKSDQPTLRLGQGASCACLAYGCGASQRAGLRCEPYRLCEQREPPVLGSGARWPCRGFQGAYEPAPSSTEYEGAGRGACLCGCDCCGGRMVFLPAQRDRDGQRDRGFGAGGSAAQHRARR